MEVKNKLVSVKEILALKLDPVIFYVDKLIPQGVTLLASNPKLGKSWMCMDMGISIANGTDFMGYKTTKAATLYLALEDSVNRIQDRLLKVLGTKTLIPDNFYIKTRIDDMDAGLLQQLKQYTIDYPDLKVIIIDTLQKIRGTATRNDNGYAHDYKELGKIKEFADTNKLSIILVHHLRKSNVKSDTDIFERISGTTAISGAADTMIALSKKLRTDVDTVLSITGRDVEYNDFIIQFNKDIYKWNIVGDAEAEAERREQEQYNINPLVITINKLVNGSVWKGTAQDIINECCNLTGKFMDIRPNEVGKEIRKLANRLYNNDAIIYTAPNDNGSAGKRIHTFKDKSYGFIT